MAVIKSRKSLGEKYIILVHLLVGVAVFYFLAHPLTMVIYWFEMNGTPFSLNLFLAVAPGRILDSFSFHMTGMSVAFILMGAFVELGSGLYYRKILQKTKMLRRQGEQLKKNILTVIKEGESDRVEFKSSLRYDYHQNCINKDLEEVIVKTIAGFMNSDGGEVYPFTVGEGGIPQFRVFKRVPPWIELWLE